MKKIFALMAFAALVLVACNDKDNPKKPGKDKGGDDEEYVAPIKIDGDFADWAKLDASKVATATCAANAAHPALKVVKVYADEYFVFVYFEWDKDLIEHEPDVEHVPFHVYINSDGDAATGGFADQFTDACMDGMFEGFIYPDGAAVGSYSPGVYKWVGEPNGSGWDDCWEDLGEIADLTAGAGIDGKYEMSISRDLYPVGPWADNFSIGFDIQQDWDSIGILPNAEPTDENPSDHAASLQVVTVK